MLLRSSVFAYIGRVFAKLTSSVYFFPAFFTIARAQLFLSATLGTVWCHQLTTDGAHCCICKRVLANRASEGMRSARDKGRAPMSDTDGFIDEVTEEVRRDRLYGYLRKYGWIGVLFVLLVVGGTAYQTWATAQATERAQTLGDSILTALDAETPGLRSVALDTVLVEDPGANATRRLLQAAAELEAGNAMAARETLLEVENNPELPLIYRQIASFKGLTGAASELDVDTRVQGFTALTVPGNPLRLLAEEQLALIDIEVNETKAAIDRFQSILLDAEATAGLQRRAVQAIVSLGGEPDVSALVPQDGN